MVDQAMLDFVRRFIESRDPFATKLERPLPFRHLADHCFRCYRWAQRIVEVEGGDADVAEVSALFHDIGKCVDNTREGHAVAGAEICAQFLDGIEYVPAKRDRIASIVRHHIEHCCSEESSLEARIESDADILDETGVMTVLWDCMAQGAEREQSYRIARDRVYRTYRNLQKKTRASFQTEAGWRFFRERRECLDRFVRHLDFELGLTLRLNDRSQPSVAGDG
jgi:putative nucleotidyltransferase with HDIG domain